jgi:lipoprotein signal peptidase
MIARFLLWVSAGAVALSADLVTKAAPHDVYAYNYAHTPLLVFLLVGFFLCVLGVWHSRLLSVGAGLMFGGLCGNAGQLLLMGYATDWIPVHGWLTNVADIAGAVGLVCCFFGYVVSAVQRSPQRERVRSDARG